MVPDAHNARILLPSVSNRVTSRLLTGYRALRNPSTRVVRGVLGSAARAGLPIARDQLLVQVRRGTGAEAELPLAVIGQNLGQEVHAAVGIRSGDNRKTTLQLVDCSGRPAGYAKLGWNRTTDAAIENEVRALRTLPHDNETVKAPELTAAFSYGGHSVAVIAPLPPQVRSVARSAPSAQELFTLAPVRRHGRLSQTQQALDLHESLTRLQDSATVTDLARRALSVLTRAFSVEADAVPITERWHGDMAPWNQAREPDNTLWLWDWESSADDAIAGLDALHWADSVHRLSAAGSTSLRDHVEAARQYLVSVGLDERDQKTVAAVYAVTMAERSCALADEAGTWDHDRQGQLALARLVTEAESLLMEVR